MRGLARAALVGAAACALLPATASSAAAHPLGNFTVNHYTGVVVRSDRVVVDHVVDSAEIPAFQRRGEVDANGDKAIDGAERTEFSAAECSREVGRLDLTVGGRSAALAVTAASLELVAGAAGLDTMRLTCAAESRITLADTGSQVVLSRATTGRIGWSEMTARGDGTTLSESSVPAASISARLTAYPEDLLQSPPAVDTLSVVARPGGARLAAGSGAAPAATGVRGIDRATAAFQDFVGRRELSPLVGLLALLFAVALGAIHALAPGHGKTVMAAFIVGERGSLRQAWVIALTVTITHTAGVLVLGIAFSAADLAAPRVYGLLGLASGVLLASVGAVLLTRAVRQRTSGRAATYALVTAPARELVHAGAQGDDHHARPHPHAHPHPHEHEAGHPHPHEHEAAHPHPHEHEAADSGRHTHGLFSHKHVVPAGDKPLGWRSIVAMGFAGGLVPSPSALVVLLGAVALGRTWFGVILVIAYGAGMALTLTGTGLLLSRASRRLGAGATHLSPRWQRALRAARLLPFATAGVVLTVGVSIALQGLREAM